MPNTLATKVRRANDAAMTATVRARRGAMLAQVRAMIAPAAPAGKVVAVLDVQRAMTVAVRGGMIAEVRPNAAMPHCRCHRFLPR